MARKTEDGEPGRMNRREFVVGSGSVVAGLVGGGAAHAGPPDPEPVPLTAPPCGLYCGTCDEFVSGGCHGCGCACGKCAGEAHARGCEMHRCAGEHKAEHCGRCREFACTRLIGFCHDPIWLGHQTVIENLRRRRRIGTKAWVAEQQDYWKDPDRMKRMMFLAAECNERARKLGG